MLEDVLVLWLFLDQEHGIISWQGCRRNFHHRGVLGKLDIVKIWIRVDMSINELTCSFEVQSTRRIDSVQFVLSDRGQYRASIEHECVDH